MKPSGLAAASCVAAALIACSTDTPAGPDGREAVASSSSPSALALSASSCTNVQGSATFELVGPEDEGGGANPGQITGDLEGTFESFFVELTPRGGGASHALFLTDFVTNLGNFSTSDLFVLPPTRNGIQAFSGRLGLQQPDGGFLHVAGSFDTTQDPVAGEWSYHGRVCVS